MLEQASRELLYFKVPVFVTDLLIHLVTLWALLFLFAPLYGIEGIGPCSLKVYGLLALSFSCAIAMFRLRLHERKIKAIIVVWRAILQTVATYVLFITLLALVYKELPRHLVVTQIGTTLVLISLWHYVFNKMVRQLRRLGHNSRHVLIVGGDPIASRLYKELKRGQSVTGYKILGYFSSREKPDMPDEATHLGRLTDFFDWIQVNHPDDIYCTLPPATMKSTVDAIIKVCNDRFIEFTFVPLMEGYPHRHMNISNMGKLTVIKLREEPMTTLKCKVFKRLVDVVVSGLFLCTVYPFVCLFVWLGDKLSGSEGPLYFRQERTGYTGKSFKVYKFRSMKVNADADKVQATKDDPRKTKFGDFLRRSSIDELPQFINVLKGDMSIVGPRPHMVFHTEMYSQLIGNYMVRHLAKPGITGWAQINGCRGETKTVEEMADRVEHDIWYIEHWTPLLDIEIFFKTIWQVMPGRDKQAY